MGVYKNSDLVCDAFTTVTANLCNVKVFHTDRENEFNRLSIDDEISIKENLRASVHG